MLYPRFRAQIIRPSGVDLGVLIRKVVNEKGGERGSPSSIDWVVSVEGNDTEENVSERNLIPARRPVSETKEASSGGAANVTEDDKALEVTAEEAARPGKKGANGCRDIVTSVSVSNSNKVGTRTTRRQRGDDSGLFVGDIDKIEKAKAKKPPKRIREPVSGPHETVVKVKLLTGTVSIHISMQH